MKIRKKYMKANEFYIIHPLRGCLRGANIHSTIMYPLRGYVINAI
jgi:hypothetical protein